VRKEEANKALYENRDATGSILRAATPGPGGIEDREKELNISGRRLLKILTIRWLMPE
jgi:hypothetical protein